MTSTPPRSDAMSPGLTAVFAVACGAMVANLYYSQALIGLIAPAIGLAPRMAGFTVTLTQLGYGAGLLFIVSLADTDENRGRVVGNIMGGLVTGIMLARPAASFLAASFGWRAIFWVSAAGMVALEVLLMRMLPQRRPRTNLHYGQILVSSMKLLFTQPVIRRRAAYQATMFAAFNLFWTGVPLFLAQRFALGQRGIALFALAGAGGALAAPIAGRLADRGYIRAGTMGALGAAVIAFMVAGWSGAAGVLVMLAAGAILLDAATQFNQVVSQRVIYAIAPEARGRITSVYMTAVFLGGATGSSLAPATLIRGGWTALSVTGGAMLAAAFLLFLTE